MVASDAYDVLRGYILKPVTKLNISPMRLILSRMIPDRGKVSRD
jgi:hypothetical protein